MRMSCVSLAAIVVAVASCAASAAAQTESNATAREEARAIFERANVLMENENWEVALAEFQRSFDLYPTRSALFNLAMCEKALHRYRAALGHFADWQTRHGDAAPDAERESVARTIDEIRQLVGFLVVSSSPSGASVLVDDERIGTTPLSDPAPLDAVRHVVEVSLDGHVPIRQEILVTPLETVTLDLTLEAIAEAPPDVSVPEMPPPVEETDEGLDSAWFWATASTAVALGIGGAVAGGIAIDTRADLDDLASRCRDGDRASCDDGRSRVDDLDAAETATNALLFSAAGVAIAAVVLVFFTDFGGDEEPPVSAGIAPATAPDGDTTGATVWMSVVF